MRHLSHDDEPREMLTEVLQGILSAMVGLFVALVVLYFLLAGVELLIKWVLP